MDLNFSPLSLLQSSVKNNKKPRTEIRVFGVLTMQKIALYEILLELILYIHEYVAFL